MLGQLVYTGVVFFLLGRNNVQVLGNTDTKKMCDAILKVIKSRPDSDKELCDINQQKKMCDAILKVIKSRPDSDKELCDINQQLFEAQSFFSCDDRKESLQYIMWFHLGISTEALPDPVHVSDESDKAKYNCLVWNSSLTGSLSAVSCKVAFIKAEDANNDYFKTSFQITSGYSLDGNCSLEVIICHSCEGSSSSETDPPTLTVTAIAVSCDVPVTVTCSTAITDDAPVSTSTHGDIVSSTTTDDTTSSVAATATDVSATDIDSSTVFSTITNITSVVTATKVTNTINTQTKETGLLSRKWKITGGVVGGILGGVVITIIVSVAWWICRRRRSVQAEDGKDMTVHYRKGSEGVSNIHIKGVLPDVIETPCSQSEREASANDYHVISERSVRHKKHITDVHLTETPKSGQIVSSSQQESASRGDYVDIQNVDLDGVPIYCFAKSVQPKQEAESENSGNVHDTYDRLGSYSKASNSSSDTYNRLGDVASKGHIAAKWNDKNPSANYFILEADSRGSYNRLRAKADVSRHYAGTYDNVCHSNQHQEVLGKDGNTQEYFILEKTELPPTNDISNRLGGIPNLSKHNPKFNNDKCVTTEQGKRCREQSTPEYFVLENVGSLHGQDTYNRLGSVSRAGELSDTYNRLGDVSGETNDI